MKIDQIPLGAAGIDYVRSRLECGHTLSRCLLQHNLEFQHAYTLLPRGTDSASLADFESGGKLPGGIPQAGEYAVRTPNTDTVLCDVIRAHLEAAPNNVCILEDFLARREDPSISSLQNVFFFDREVYHFVLPSEREDGIRTALRTAQSLPQFVGGLTRCRAGMVNLERGSVTRDLLQDLALDAHAIIAGAYDGESYVIAER